MGGMTTRPRTGRLALALVLLALASLAGSCKGSPKSLLGRAELPDLGPPLPYTIKLDIDPSLPAARLQYVDACNHPSEMHIGNELEALLLEGAHQTFKTVYYQGPEKPAAAPDLVAKISLLQSGLKVQTDNMYDRLPAEMHLEAGLAIYDAAGKLLLERPLTTTHREKLILEPTQHRCAYVSAGAFTNAAATEITTQFMKQARSLFKQPEQAAVLPAAPPPAAPAAPAPAGAPGLAFKATLLEESGNLVLESGEKVRVRVDVVNAGQTAARDVRVSVSGTPAVVSQFPATTLPVGTLQPGESRSVEFVGTLPPSVPPQRAELTVALTEGSGAVGIPASQMLVASLRSGGGGAAAPGPAVPAAPVFDDVDRVPPASGARQPNVYVIAIGIPAYRDQQPLARKYAAADAELLSAYLGALGGVPSSNVKVLVGTSALRPDIEELLLDWLPARVNEQSVVIVYFAGLAMASPSGEVSLLPYDAGANGSSRLYPLKELAAALGRLRTKQSLLIFDGPVARLGGGPKGQQKPLRWDVGGDTPVRLVAAAGLQPALEPDLVRHGLLTYYVLRGLRGDADKDGNGGVTLGELAAYLSQTLPSVSRGTFKQELQPQILPPLRPGSPLEGLVLTRPGGASPASR